MNNAAAMEVQPVLHMYIPPIEDRGCGDLPVPPELTWPRIRGSNTCSCHNQTAVGYIQATFVAAYSTASMRTYQPVPASKPSSMLRQLCSRAGTVRRSVGSMVCRAASAVPAVDAPQQLRTLEVRLHPAPLIRPSCLPMPAAQLRSRVFCCCHRTSTWITPLCGSCQLTLNAATAYAR